MWDIFHLNFTECCGQLINFIKFSKQGANVELTCVSTGGEFLWNF